MNWKNSLLIVLAMTATCGTFAQPVYKTIGPDGKTVYSDKPPDSANTKTTVINAPVQPSQTSATTDAARRPPDAPVAATGITARKATAKKAQRPEAPRNEAPAELALDPAVDKAMVGVMGMEDLVRQTEDLCLRTLPTSFKRYNTAAANWKQRNAAVVAQQRRVLSEAFDASKRQLIEAAVKAGNQKNLAPILNAPTFSKIKWCDQSSDEINSGVMDVHNKPNLASPLLNYRPNK
jgi:hypothetical protein